MKLLIVLAILSVAAKVESSAISRGQDAKIECSPPFTVIGNRCIFVDNLSSGIYNDMRYLCQVLGGDIIILDDAELLYDIVDFIRVQGLSDSSYWIGASDAEEEGRWKWIDGTDVRMGTPFWANSGSDNIQQPAGGTAQNHACLQHGYHYYFNDRVGETDLYGVICETQPVSNGPNVSSLS